MLFSGTINMPSPHLSSQPGSSSGSVSHQLALFKAERGLGGHIASEKVPCSCSWRNILGIWHTVIIFCEKTHHTDFTPGSSMCYCLLKRWVGHSLNLWHCLVSTQSLLNLDHMGKSPKLSQPLAFLGSRLFFPPCGR